MAESDTAAATPAPPFLTEAELDELYLRDPVAALRQSRRQAEWLRAIEAAPVPGAPAPSEAEVRAVLDEAAAILRRDGGDLELAALVGNEVSVRMKGKCAGCPRSALDMKQVVERTLRSRFPGVRIRRIA